MLMACDYHGNVRREREGRIAERCLTTFISRRKVPSERDVRSGTFFPRREGAKGAINFGGGGGDGGSLSLLGTTFCGVPKPTSTFSAPPESS